MLSVMRPNTRRSVAEEIFPAEAQTSSSAVSITTQEGFDGNRERTMWIEGVEQVEMGNIMELSVTGHVLGCARPSNSSGGGVVSKADGWNPKNHCDIRVARPWREKTHPSLLVVTLKERGLYSAALEELVNIIKDQSGERSVVVLVLTKESEQFGRHQA